MFQFQYGTIKSPFAEETDIFLNRFNSSMVRLKALAPEIVSAKAPFQFQYGTIKRVIKHAEGYNISGFNSSMVRLKA